MGLGVSGLGGFGFRGLGFWGFGVLGFWVWGFRGFGFRRLGLNSQSLLQPKPLEEPGRPSTQDFEKFRVSCLGAWPSFLVGELVLQGVIEFLMCFLWFCNGSIRVGEGVYTWGVHTGRGVSICQPRFQASAP